MQSRLPVDYRGSYLSFINNWLDCIRRFERLSPISVHMSDDQKKDALQAVLFCHPKFLRIDDYDFYQQSSGMLPNSYEQYLASAQRIAMKLDQNRPT